MSTVRVKSDVQCVVSVEGEMVALVPDAPFDADDPVVRQCPWAFADAGTARLPQRSVSLDVEQATARPGEKRNR